MLKLSLLSNSTFLIGTNAKKSPVVAERLNNAVDRGKGQRSYYRELQENGGVIVEEGITYNAIEARIQQTFPNFEGSYEMPDGSFRTRMVAQPTGRMSNHEPEMQNMPVRVRKNPRLEALRYSDGLKVHHD